MPPTRLAVTLLAHTPDALALIYAAFRQCYHAGDVADLWPRLLSGDIGPDKQAAFVARILESGHESPIEHVSFTFAVSGVSRALSHQLVRHRIASYDQQSQRYVAAHGFQYITPPTIAEKPEAKAKYAALMEEIRSVYDELTEMGVPKEDARYVLANATETKILVTMNARSLMHFFNLRCCNRAQWEIREMAYKMLAEVKKVAPTLFFNAGASCVNTGRCPEGEMTCGKFAEMIKLREKD